MNQAQELLSELNAVGIKIYLKNGWITTADSLSDSQLMRLSKCSTEMRALLKTGEIFRETTIGPETGPGNDVWGVPSN